LCEIGVVRVPGLLLIREEVFRPACGEEDYREILTRRRATNSVVLEKSKEADPRSERSEDRITQHDRSADVEAKREKRKKPEGLKQQRR